MIASTIILHILISFYFPYVLHFICTITYATLFHTEFINFVTQCAYIAFLYKSLQNYHFLISFLMTR